LNSLDACRVRLLGLTSTIGVADREQMQGLTAFCLCTLEAHWELDAGSRSVLGNLMASASATIPRRSIHDPNN